MDKKVILVGNEGSPSKEALRKLIASHPEIQPIMPRKSQTSALTAFAAMSMLGLPLVKPFQKQEKTPQKCGLKECNIMTIRDFCCAEHYRIAKAKHKS